MRKIIFYILLIGAMSFLFSAYGYYYDAVDKVKFQGFNGEGSFVEGPAYTGAVFGYVLGILPAAVITEPQRIANYDEESNTLGTDILAGFAKPFDVMFGGIPYLLKKGFWDFPIWVFNGSNKENDYYEYKPAPPPAVKIDPRLLVEEKPAEIQTKTNVLNPTIIKIPQEPISEKKSTVEPKLININASQKQSELPAPSLTPLPTEKSTIDTELYNPSNEEIPSEQQGQEPSQKWESSDVPDWVSKEISQ